MILPAYKRRLSKKKTVSPILLQIKDLERTTDSHMETLLGSPHRPNANFSHSGLTAHVHTHTHTHTHTP